jgi:hypothetical protein
MELTEGSETSANHNLPPRKYPKEYIQYSKHGESLKSRIREFSSNFRSFSVIYFILVRLLFMGRGKNACRLLTGKPEGKSHLEELGVDGRIVLRLILTKRDGSLD